MNKADKAFYRQLDKTWRNYVVVKKGTRIICELCGKIKVMKMDTVSAKARFCSAECSNKSHYAKKSAK